MFFGPFPLSFGLATFLQDFKTLAGLRRDLCGEEHILFQPGYDKLSWPCLLSCSSPSNWW